MTYGSGVLVEVLAVVDPPEGNGLCGEVIRCSLETPWQLVSYYSSHDHEPIPSLTKLTSILGNGLLTELTRQQKDRLTSAFTELVQSRFAHENLAKEARRKAHESSLTEQIRQLLVEAVYVELALAADRGLFDEGLVLDFSEEAYKRLKPYGVPFRGALRVAGSGLPRPRPDDPRYLRLQEFNRDALMRKFEAVRMKMTDRLRQLTAAWRNTPMMVEKNAVSTSAVALVCFAASTSVNLAATNHSGVH